MAQSRQAWDGRPSPLPCENIMTWTVGTIHYDMSPLRSVLRSGRRKMNVERPVLRLWYPKMTRFTFGVLQDKRRTLRSTFGAPQERESRLHRFRPESPQQTLGSQGAPPTERRTGRSHCLLAVAVVALAEGPRARPSHLAFNIIISTSISSAGCGKYHLRSTPSIAVRIKSTQYHVSCF